MFKFIGAIYHGEIDVRADSFCAAALWSCGSEECERIPSFDGRRSPPQVSWRQDDVASSQLYSSIFALVHLLKLQTALFGSIYTEHTLQLSQTLYPIDSIDFTHLHYTRIATATSSLLHDELRIRLRNPHPLPLYRLPISLFLHLPPAH